MGAVRASLPSASSHLLQVLPNPATLLVSEVQIMAAKPRDSLSLEEYLTSIGLSDMLPQFEDAGANSLQLMLCLDLIELVEALKDDVGLNGAQLKTFLQIAHSDVEESVMRITRELLVSTSAETLTAETQLMEAGLTTDMAEELSLQLETLTGVSLSSTILFECPTPREVAMQVLQQVLGDDGYDDDGVHREAEMVDREVALTDWAAEIAEREGRSTS
jgi:hypothetical protein